MIPRADRGRLERCTNTTARRSCSRPAPSTRAQALDLLGLERGINVQGFERLLVALDLLVDADHDAVFRVDLHLKRKRRVGDLAPGEALLDRLDHSSKRVDLTEVLVSQLLHPIGQRFDEI